MKIHADEGVDRAMVVRLRQDGHQVVYIAETASGWSDEKVLNAAYENTALLITADKDFGNLVFTRGLQHAGVLLLRLAGLAADDKSRLVSDAVQSHGAEMQSAFSVLTGKQLRVRVLTPKL